MNEVDKPMYFGAKPDIFQKATALKFKMTNAEDILWQHLKNSQFLQLKFRRQHPIDIFIADFYCHKLKLVIELDGKSHVSTKEYDEGRSKEMERFGIKVIRFTNEDVIKNVNEVLSKIEKEIETLKK